MDDLGLKRRRRVVARRSCGAAAEKIWEREECGQIVFCAKVEHIRTGDIICRPVNLLTFILLRVKLSHTYLTPGSTRAGDQRYAQIPINHIPNES